MLLIGVAFNVVTEMHYAMAVTTINMQIREAYTEV